MFTDRIQSNSVVRSAAIACAAGVVLLCGAGIAKADMTYDARTLDEPRRSEVYFGDLDLATEDGTRVLYARIVKAAHTVCPERFSRDTAKASKGRECVAQAIERAVSEVGNERVAALDAARTRRLRG